LVVKEIEGYPNNELSVYSRSGALVFKANSYDNTWDGTNIFTNGRAKLPDGSYFFVLDLKTPGVDVVQGWIYIKY
jgi:gliding motility-associated-like protein